MRSVPPFAFDGVTCSPRPGRGSLSGLRLWILSLALLVLGQLQAQTPLLPAGGIQALGFQHPDASSATRTVVAVAGQPFSQAVRVVTAKVPANAWNTQLSLPTTSAVAAGDVVAGEVWLRRITPTPGTALAEIVFEKAGPPYDQSIVRVLSEESGNWTRYRFAFTSLAAHGAGGAQFNIRLGHAVQTIELAGLTLSNYAKASPLSSFPNDVSYAGREADAAWRATARDSIEKVRKANLTLDLRDAHGFPLADVPVEVQLRRHAFAFGSAVAASRLLSSGADSDRYRGVITQWFNTVVLENDLKWPQYEADPSQAQRAVDWLLERNIQVRGHNLIWPGTNQPSFLPANVPPLFSDPTRLRARINSHFTNVLDRFRGRIADWDVVNEPLHERVIEGILGRPEVAGWFQLARTLDPAATLYLNEYVNLEAVTRAGSTQLRNYADSLRNLGAPIDALGLQSHFAGFLTSPPEILARLDLISGIHGGADTYPLRITEFDINTSDEVLQGDYTRDFLTATFSHPSVSGVLLWGFWENQHWLPNGALFRANWQSKPNAVAWSNLVFNTWTTRTNVQTSTSGKAVARGFKGDYEITVRLPGTNVTVLARLDTDATVRPVVPVVRPEIQVTQGNLFEYSWPAYASGYRLEVSDQLNPPDWQPVEGFARLSQGAWRLQLPSPTQTQFYRLRRGGP